MGWLGRSRSRVAPGDAKKPAGHAANAYTMTDGDLSTSHHVHASPSASAPSSSGKCRYLVLPPTHPPTHHPPVHLPIHPLNHPLTHHT